MRSSIAHRTLGVVALLVAVLGVPMGTAGSSPPAPAVAAPVPPDASPASPPDVLAPDGRWTVTLITGEVVDVRSDAEGRVSAVARERVGPVRTVRTPDGELYLIPLSVTPLLDEVLDRELFNVTGLIRQGYDDASIDVVPLIVERRPGMDVRSSLAASGDERPLPSIGAVATEVAKADAEATGALLAGLGGDAERRAGPGAGVGRIWLDRQVTTLAARSTADIAGAAQAPAELDGNLTQVGADDAWAAGFTGAGVTVAVLDTGVDAGHPDLAGKVVAEANFGDSPDTVDRYGHGTHVASIVAGSGTGSGGARSGVAPDAQLISGKVVDDWGFGLESQAIAGMEWAAPQADVVNMSLGYGVDSDGSDPMSTALDALTEQYGTLFVVAAGNGGPLSRSVEFPGAADRALTVGAVDGRDALAEFSSRGPLAGSYELKPEVVAPGVDIIAARAAGTTMGEPVDDLYVAASGTSMATPHAAGAIAVLAQQHPDWTADQLKNGLVGSSDPIDADGYDGGAGRIDIGDGTVAALRAERDVIDVPLAEPRTEPHTETLSWTNTGTEPLTVGLDAVLEDRQGRSVEAVSIAPAELTIAPGATGSATLEVDGVDLTTGLYSGVVTADPAGDDADDDLRTPIAVHAAAELVDLTIEATAPAGVAGTPFTFATVVNLDDFGEFGDFFAFDGTTLTVQVPVGRYAVTGDVSSSDRDTDVVAQVGDPDVTIAGDTTVVFDGAAAVPFVPTVTGVDTAPPMYSSSSLVVTPRAGTGGFGLQSEIYAWYPMPPVRLTPMEADPEVFSAQQVFRLQAPHLTASVGGDEIEIATVAGPELAAGAHTLQAVDAGDGTDLSGATDRLAVVRLPADEAERAAVTRRAADAGVALLAFVDERRDLLTVTPFGWADVPVITAAGTAATTLTGAAARNADVTVTLTASPYVYDIVTPAGPGIDPEPVIDRAGQRALARLDERFHRDPDGVGAEGDRRYPISVSLMNLDNQGPLPRRRTAYVSPGVTWQSIVFGPGFIRIGDELLPLPSLALSMDAGATYAGGSRTTLTWLRRPQWPGPVGGSQGASYCQPTPVRRVGDTVQISLTPFQDGRDRFGCSDQQESTLTLERDGTVIGTNDDSWGEFDVPADPGTYRLSYEQTGQSPYAHRSTTAWTFRSATTGDPADIEAIPLLVVDYRLPLDTLNRPTGRTATFTAGQVTGTERQRIRRFEVWTSTDDGATWRRASIRATGGGAYRVTLPRVAAGTGVSLRVDAQDKAGNRIEQTIYDAYTG